MSLAYLDQKVQLFTKPQPQFPDIDHALAANRSLSEC
jgi:hypothetical protein